MAFEVAGDSYPQYRAGSDFSSAGQFRLVRQSTVTASLVELTTAASQIPLGILQNNPSSGQPATVWGMGGRISKLYHDGTVTLGGAASPHDSTVAANDGLAQLASTGTGDQRFGPAVQVESATTGTVISVVMSSLGRIT